MLTNYNGKAITYDAIGNPLKWRNAAAIEWQGRNLTLFSNSNGEIYNYAYNADGIRTQKNIFNANGDFTGTTEYIYDGTKLIAENRSGTWLYYFYDANGAVTGMSYGGTLYYFRKNLQGDVTGIYNAYGNIIAQYEYTPYGALLAVTDASGNDISANATHIANINPIRYRGYYYDTETGFYYLQSRYYDPVVGRFLNADVFVSTGQGFVGNNMFAYCLNNPVIFRDDNGQSIELAIPAIVFIVAESLIIIYIWEPIEKFVIGFFECIGDGITELIDTISDYIEEKQEAKAEKRASRSRQIEADKLKDILKNIGEDMCAIIFINGKTPCIYKIMPIKDVINGIMEDRLAGVNDTIPPQSENWGVFTINRSDAKYILYIAFGSADEDLSWIGHSPLPHFHTNPHKISINGLETTPHAWFLTYE